MYILKKLKSLLPHHLPPLITLLIKRDDDLAYHSFYESEGDSESTKKCCEKKEKAVKDPASSNEKDKQAQKQAFKE
ncbi:hypothetical protein DSO57_1018909 [Entomophthora muscae]|uniref:Uncharacterized protein n=1 Tax=Entomophthora muscae TaxID=34485 RepID=A0ACC2TRS7_9FUNG|nr:hypothetical protein DSO57_1018909 [Entomophthora muscae]